MRFAVVGTGYRSEFYARAAKQDKNLELVLWLARNKEKKEKLEKLYNIHTSTDENELINLKPNFIVVCVDKLSLLDVSIHYASLGFPVLMETPCANSIEDLEKFKNAINKGLKIQVAEQYTKTKYISELSRIVKSNILGEVTSLTLSYAHEYHAISIARELLSTSKVHRIVGIKQNTSITRTKDRYNTYNDGTIINNETNSLIIEYKDSKVLNYIFTSEEYRSLIRKQYINVFGTRGQILGRNIYYLDSYNKPQEKYIRTKIENSDEYAINIILNKMKDYIEKGIEVYKNEDAIQDAYLAIKMREALSNNFKVIEINK